MRLIADDLLIFRMRMNDRGIRVRLPSAGEDYRLPEPFEVAGRLLSDTVIHLRRAAPHENHQRESE